MEDQKKALFFEDDRVEIKFEKLPGSLSFKRSIAALTVDSAVKAMAALVSHFAELVNARPGDVLARIAAELLAPEDPAAEEIQAAQEMAQDIAMGLRPPEYPGDCQRTREATLGCASVRTGSQ